jgi:anhydro-N-acetylmuramic acid kinase
MSGTSLDGVDGALAFFPPDFTGGIVKALATAYIPFPHDLRVELMALQAASTDELHKEALAANRLAQCYAQCVAELLKKAGIQAQSVSAIGVHGQTIRHRPEHGYTRQTNNPALLAELTGIDVIADFRSRDIAAGGQGAPLVPAFHQAILGSNPCCVVVNIGGISNISILKTQENDSILGFDTGPGNVLMDAWIARHLNKSYDANGDWAASGTVIPGLLQTLCDEPFLKLAPPKSTGRDLFHFAWLTAKLSAFDGCAPQDIQATLAEFTAHTIAQAIALYAPTTQAVYACGGGAYNGHLMHRLEQLLHQQQVKASVQPTDGCGIPANHVEALAFAWLAYRFVQRQPGNLPTVTGAQGPRILGALFPA